MRRCLLGMALAALVLLAGCASSHPHPRLWTTTNTSRFAADPSYAVQLNWAGVTIPSITGYFVTLNGDQQADLAPTATFYHFTGLDCGTTYTLGVQAHNGSGGTSTAHTTTYTSPDCPSESPFPLQVSTNGRFLENASGDPWLMVGDSPQSVIGNLSETNADAYLADRASHGFNTVWMNLLCDDYTDCASNGQTADSIKPFNTGTAPSSYDVSTPNSTYFTRAHNIVSQAQTDGLEVVLDPIETGGCQPGWITTLNNNGTGSTTSGKDFNYGAFVATEFEDTPNVIWMMGNDYTCFGTTTTDANLLAVVNGILSVTPDALITSEVGESANDQIGDTSLDDDTHDWAAVDGLNGFYTYAPAYANARRAYAQSSPTIPSFMAETVYEGLSGAGTDGCATVRNCRLQEWWAMTSGATGQLYGGPCYGITNSTTLSSCDSTGVAELEDQTNLLTTLDWQDLVPDTSDALSTSPGTCPTTGSFVSVDCITAAETSDQTLALAYTPTGNSIVIALSHMAGSTTARWYDPTDGDFTPISGSPFAASGSHTFTTPGDNNAGDSDWVLVLQAS